MILLSLALYAKRKQKYQNGNIYRKLRVPTSEREGELSNPRASAPRARDAWRRFTEIHGNPRGQVYSKYIGYYLSSERNGVYTAVPE